MSYRACLNIYYPSLSFNNQSGLTDKLDCLIYMTYSGFPGDFCCIKIFFQYVKNFS